ncbi:hypothetical protein ES702_01070 [subsurface metagenome]
MMLGEGMGMNGFELVADHLFSILWSAFQGEIGLVVIWPPYRSRVRLSGNFQPVDLD